MGLLFWPLTHSVPVVKYLKSELIYTYSGYIFFSACASCVAFLLGFSSHQVGRIQLKLGASKKKTHGWISERATFPDGLGEGTISDWISMHNECERKTDRSVQSGDAVYMHNSAKTPRRSCCTAAYYYVSYKEQQKSETWASCSWNTD